MSLHKLN